MPRQSNHYLGKIYSFAFGRVIDGIFDEPDMAGVLLRHPNCDAATEADARYVERESKKRDLKFERVLVVGGAEHLVCKQGTPEEEFLQELLTWVQNDNEVFDEDLLAEVMQSNSSL